MNCLYYDEDKKRCVNPYSFYKGTDCPMKVCQDMCKLYREETDKTEEIVQDLRCCAEDNCGRCNIGEKTKCCNKLLKMAADELERLMEDKE